MLYKWTVLFLVHASTQQTRDYVRELFEILESTRYSKDIKVIVLYSALQHSDYTGKVQIQVTLKELVQEKEHAHSIFKELPIGNGRVDMGDDKMLKKIFAQVRTDFPSERFLMFTWDHGFGFGIFKANPKERRFGAAGPFSKGFPGSFSQPFNNAEDNDEAMVIINNNYSMSVPVTRDFSGIRGVDKENVQTSMLTNEELRNTILYNEDATKADLLVMMNCAMQMIETGYALHDAVDFLVAPETCIFWAGYDYKKIIDRLGDEPNISTKELGIFTLDTMQPYYEKVGSGKYFKDLVVSLVQPGQSVKIKKVIDDISIHLESRLNDAFGDVKKIRNGCEDLTRRYVSTPYHCVDFIHCIAALNQNHEGLNMQGIKHQIDEYVVHIIKGANYSKTVFDNNIGQVNGFTIYYPPTARDGDTDYYYKWFYTAGSQQSLFAKDCAWQDFLQAYFRHDRNGQHTRSSGMNPFDNFI